MKIRILTAEGTERATEIATIEVQPDRSFRFGLELMKFLATWNEAPTAKAQEATAQTTTAPEMPRSRIGERPLRFGDQE
jgi:hypothetical protein